MTAGSDPDPASGSALDPDPPRPSGGAGTGPVLDVEGLDHSFGDVDVLADLSLSLSPGSVTALVGPNGSGKTTLLRILAGLLAPDAGRVRHGATAPRPVGYLPQSPAFRSGFTAEETLSFYGDLLPGEVDVAAALSAVGLSAVGDRPVNALSGGMRRLLGVAQATLGDPPLVLLDEPTGDLDPKMTRHVFETVHGLGDAGTTVLLATHNLAGAERADRVLVLDGGSIVADGSPDELIAESGGQTLTDAFVHFVADEAATVRAGIDVGVAVDRPGPGTVSGDGESAGEAGPEGSTAGEGDDRGRSP